MRRVKKRLERGATSSEGSEGELFLTYSLTQNQIISRDFFFSRVFYPSPFRSTEVAPFGEDLTSGDPRKGERFHQNSFRGRCRN
ncbi:hypothetical protein CEXT_420581 [Caerostris extrusa]|uniref:Uncharacterized protein n=1 Tax=Caerostris extrusa TaxID=172846 RepID=A0AAV4T3L5_CAEEX|nr:hypothetical protein CEXT_420581 [Caerostris extrusa]